MTRKLVFVSYSRADEPEHPGEGEVRWLTFVLGYLNAAFKGAEVDIFFDRSLAIGTGWSQEIERRSIRRPAEGGRDRRALQDLPRRPENRRRHRRLGRRRA